MGRAIIAPPPCCCDFRIIMACNPETPEGGDESPLSPWFSKSPITRLLISPLTAARPLSLCPAGRALTNCSSSWTCCPNLFLAVSLGIPEVYLEGALGLGCPSEAGRRTLLDGSEDMKDKTKSIRLDGRMRYHFCKGILYGEEAAVFFRVAGYYRPRIPFISACHIIFDV